MERPSLRAERLSGSPHRRAMFPTALNLQPHWFTATGTDGESLARTLATTLGRLLLVVTSIVFALFVAEWVLRSTIVPIQNHTPWVRGGLVADSEIGYRLAPNQRTVMSNGHYRVEIRTDRRGNRDVFDAALPNPGYVAIGDSQTFGHGVEAEETWVEQLQEMLGANVVNTGVLGYSVTQYEPLLRRLHTEQQPVRVVLYGMSWNDLLSGRVLADVKTVVDGDLVANPAYVAPREDLPLRTRLLSEPVIQGFIYHTAIGLRIRALGNSILGSLGVAAHSVSAASLDAESEHTKRVLLGINGYLQTIGAQLVIVHLANANLSMTDLWEDYRRRYSHSRYFARETLSSWAQQHGILFADATEDLERRYLESGMERTSLILPVDNHYNVGGHEVIARVFQRVLEDKGLADPDDIVPSG